MGWRRICLGGRHRNCQSSLHHSPAIESVRGRGFRSCADFGRNMEQFDNLWYGGCPACFRSDLDLSSDSKRPDCRSDASDHTGGPGLRTWCVWGSDWGGLVRESARSFDREEFRSSSEACGHWNCTAADWFAMGYSYPRGDVRRTKKYTSASSVGRARLV